MQKRQPSLFLCHPERAAKQRSRRIRFPSNSPVGEGLDPPARFSYAEPPPQSRQPDLSASLPMGTEIEKAQLSLLFRQTERHRKPVPQTVKELYFLALPLGELSCDSMTERVYGIFSKQIFGIFGFSLSTRNPLRPADAGHLSHRERQGPFLTRSGVSFR